MPSQKGRDLLLKIGDGSGPESFTAIGAARTTAMTINNQPADATTMDSAGFQVLLGDAGAQTMHLRLEGLFKDAAAEELLRAAAFARTAKNYELWFPNGDKYAASFVVQEYQRGGAFDGLETFSVTLARSGAGTFTAGP
ncbi:MAG: phage tail tube protein [Alphaproteobacteria bacterium]